MKECKPINITEESARVDKKIREVLKASGQFYKVDSEMEKIKLKKQVRISKSGKKTEYYDLAPEIMIQCPVCLKGKAKICKDTFGLYRFIQCHEKDCGLYIW